MSDPNPTTNPLPGTDSPDRATALFASLLMQQTNMALMFLGKAPNPETNQADVDLEAASLFIDTLAMLAAKTKGNLTPAEHQLLQGNLTSLRLQFVEAAEAGVTSSGTSPTAGASPTAAAQGSPSPESSAEAAISATSAPADDARKKFVKKY
jgi:hypothetical protein